MRPVGRKRARTLARRREIVQRADPQVCPRCHAEPAVDPHELVNRSQGDTAADIELIVPIGRTCHDWVTTHPTEARDEGFALRRKDKDDPAAHREAYLRRLDRGYLA